MENTYIMVSATFGSKEEAKRIAEILLSERLVCCCQFIKIESSYIWKSKTEEAKEVLVQMKSKKKLYKEIEKTILKNHSYETPEIFAVNITSGSKDYLEWIDKETK